jgi:hypothetical protein
MVDGHTSSSEGREMLILYDRNATNGRYNAIFIDQSQRLLSKAELDAALAKTKQEMAAIKRQEDALRRAKALQDE